MVPLAVMLLAGSISYEASAVPLDRVLKELGPKLGMRLEASAPTKNEILAIRTDGVDPQSLLDRIAQVAEAKWETKPDGTRRLVRPDAMVREAREASNRRRSEAIQKAINEQLPYATSRWTREAAQNIAELEKRRLNGGSGDPDIQKQVEQRPSMPVPRAIVQLLAAIPVAELATMIPGERVVYSNFPNRRQRALPLSTLGLWGPFVKEQSMYSELQRGQQGDQYGRTRMGGVNNSLSGDGDPSKGVGKVILGLQWNGSTRLEARLIVADTARETIAWGETYLRIGTPVPKIEDMRPFPVSAPVQGYAKAYTDCLSASFEFGGSRMSQSNVYGTATFEQLNPSKPAASVPADQFESLLNPEKRDPLWIVGDTLIQLAKMDNLNLVANVPDTQSYNSAIILSKPTTVGDIRRFLVQTLFNEQKNGWLILRPGNESEARRTRTDRPALGRSLRTLDRQGFLRLDEWSTFASQSREPVYANNLPGILLRLVQPSVKPTIDALNWRMLRFWGALSPFQKQQLVAGREVPTETLPINAKADVEEEIFSRPYSLSVAGWKKIDAQTSRGLSGDQDLDAEPTEIVPEGLRNGSLKVTVDTKPGVFAIERANNVGRFLSVTALTSQRLQTEYDSFRKSYGDPIDFASYFPLTTNQLNVTFRFSPKVTMGRILEDLTFPPTARPGPYANLPADVRDAVNREFETYLKVISNGRFD